MVLRRSSHEIGYFCSCSESSGCWPWFERPEVIICDSSPGVEGLIPSTDSIVTFNYAHRLCQPTLNAPRDEITGRSRMRMTADGDGGIDVQVANRGQIWSRG